MEIYIDGLVSVIIPTYNVEKYIERTINCVLNQTYSNLEIIVIDDCSKDNTVKVVNELCKIYDNILLFVQPENKGAAEARNRGLLEAKGQYIAFLDSDDMWEPNKIEEQLNDMKLNNIAFSYTTYDFINDEEECIKKSIKIKRKTKYKNLLTKTMISTPTVVFDRKKTGNLLMPLRRTGQDYAFWLLLLRNNDAYGIDKPLVHVRRRPGSLSKNKLQNIKDVWEVQTINEKINKFYAFFHVIGYCMYALKKRLFR